MYAALSLEWRGHDTDTWVTGAAAKALGYRPIRRPWVAAIVGYSPRYGLERRFEEARLDYQDANRTGSRGVRLHWMLPEGIYEVQAYPSWRRSERYFVASVDGAIIRITRADLDRCLAGNAPPHLLPARMRQSAW